MRLIQFSRNFGHQIAVSAGIDFANGRAAVIIDADLQDPPSVIPEMVEKWKDGFEVVYGVRASRETDGAFKKLTARVFYWLIDFISEIELPKNAGDFRLIDRKVIDVIKAMPERDRYLRGLITWVGFKQAPVYFVREARFAGETKYPLNKMVKLALDGLFSFSTKPLRGAVYAGIFTIICSFFGILYSLHLRLFTNEWMPGWTLMFIVILLLGGLQLVFFGLIGEYLSRLYGEAKGRPLYILNNKLDDAPVGLRETKKQNIDD